MNDAGLGSGADIDEVGYRHHALTCCDTYIRNLIKISLCDRIANSDIQFISCIIRAIAGDSNTAGDQLDRIADHGDIGAKTCGFLAINQQTPLNAS